MKNLREKTDSELLAELGEKRKAVRLFRFGVAGSKSKNASEGRALRREIARILTETSRRAAQGGEISSNDK